MPAVLIIEDEPAIADALIYALKTENFSVTHVTTAQEGLDHFNSHAPDFAVLDIGLPDFTGFDLCRKIRDFSQVPILFLTARDSEIDQVLGLELGADDYVTKPFSPRELMARVKAILRRADSLHEPGAEPAVVDLGAGIVISGTRREATVNGDPVALAMREFDLAMYLAVHRGLALSRRQILDGVWGADWIGDDRTVDVHVRQLRKKLGDGFLLETVWGVGYRLD